METDTADREEDTLVEIRFYIPPGEQEEEVVGAEKFRQDILEVRFQYLRYSFFRVGGRGRLGVSLLVVLRTHPSQSTCHAYRVLRL